MPPRAVQRAESLQPRGQQARLLDLSRRARHAVDENELAFIAVNDSLLLARYRQAALWRRDGGIVALSGVLQPDANAPYVVWLTRLCTGLADTYPAPAEISSPDVPAPVGQEWGDWLPSHVLWLPLAEGNDANAPPAAGLLLARETPWGHEETAELVEWADIWRHAWHAHDRPPHWSPQQWRKRLLALLAPEAGRPWWRQRRIAVGLAMATIAAFPVRLSVLAPGELVPAAPAVIRAPIDGVIAQFAVRPNDTVTAGQTLFEFDRPPLEARHDVALQALATANAEYRQIAQMALAEERSKAQLAAALGKVEEKKAESAFARWQLEQARVTAPRDGIALVDDPSEWSGRPVATGERIMRVAALDDVEVEAWLAVGDAIPLEPDASVTLFLNASPLNPVSARLRYAAHDAVERPDGSYAYRVRARPEQPTHHRVGLKGTARLYGDWVPLAYWVLRRPLATLREVVGW